MSGLVWWLLGCGSVDLTGNGFRYAESLRAAEFSADPSAAVVEVTAALDHALERIRARDPDARSAVYAAFHRFEEGVEPGLRSRLPPAEVLSLEYAFGQVADAAADPPRAEAATAALKARIQALAPDAVLRSSAP